MDSHAVAIVRSAALVLLLISAAACGSTAGTAPPPGASAPSTGSATVDPSPTLASTATPAAPPSAAPATAPAGAPPAAILSSGAGDTAGDLGTFSWDGLVSDAAWIVGGAGAMAASGDSLSVTFRPADERPAGWQARWAKVVDSGPGAPSDGGSGAGPVIQLLAPATAGTWTLQLTSTFGPGRDATWYWRIEIAP
jgi:hypothetical protein